MSAPTGERPEASSWRPSFLDASPGVGPDQLREALGDPTATVLDHREAQRADLARLRRAAPGVAEEPDCWVHYPWRRTVVAVLGRRAFTTLRLDRNRNKITEEEQEQLGRLRIGVAGLSVGHAVAHTLALEGLCGELRLADFDTLDVPNLNRIPATLLDLGVNKAVVAARRIAELDPFLPVEVYEDGVTADNLGRFLDGLDVLVEECDSLDQKVALREEARRRGIPVLMETSDRGLLDVERFDREPDRPLFHGLLGAIDSPSLRSLSTEDKVPHILGILGAEDLSDRMAASLVEVGRTLTTWPQLAGDVVLGGATIAAAIRRLGTGRPLPSGRLRIDLDGRLADLEASPEHAGAPSDLDLPAMPAPRRGGEPARAVREGDEHPLASSVLHAVGRAPSGGNVQPWSVDADPHEVRLHLDRRRTTTMDVQYRGSYVALGAALLNARVVTAAAGALGPLSLFPDPSRPDLIARLRFGDAGDEFLARLAPRVDARGTNRAYGRPRAIRTATRDALRAAAAHEGGRVHVVAPGPGLVEAGLAMAAADRIRYLTPTLHREMFSELVWPGSPRDDTGIETRLLGLSEADLAKLPIVRRPEVMSLLADWDAGTALGADTRDRVASSSALAVVTTTGSSPADFVRGGSAVEAVWLTAEEHGLAVHPMSPVFLFALDQHDLTGLSARFADDLATVRGSFREAAGLDSDETVVLVLRLSHTDTPAARSKRRPLVGVEATT